jgi:hypothetical protein
VLSRGTHGEDVVVVCAHVGPFPTFGVSIAKREDGTAVVGDGFRHEHQRPVRANEKKRGRHPARITYTKSGVMLGLRQQVVEGFEFGWLLH